MRTESIDPEHPRIQTALAELKGMIAQRYPHATFEAGLGEDPDGVYLTATVDVEDTTEVFDVVVDRLVEMQVEEELPVYVVPVQPVERVLEHLRSQKHRGRRSRYWEAAIPQP